MMSTLPASRSRTTGPTRTISRWRTRCSPRSIRGPCPHTCSWCPGWSAYCPDPTDPMSCRSDLDAQGGDHRWDLRREAEVRVDRRDVVARRARRVVARVHRQRHLLAASAVPATGASRRTRRATTATCSRGSRASGTVSATGDSDNMLPVKDYLDAAADGSLPSVAWISRRRRRASIRTSASTRADRDGVRDPADQRRRCRGPTGTRTAIFLTWDDWGGFYDHVVPPRSTGTATACACPGS